LFQDILNYDMSTVASVRQGQKYAATYKIRLNNTVYVEGLLYDDII